MLRRIRKPAFALTALLVLFATVGGPVAASQSGGHLHAVDVEHEGHCHMVSDCEAVAVASHAGPALQSEFRIAKPGELSERVRLDFPRLETHFVSTVFRPPIA